MKQAEQSDLGFRPARPNSKPRGHELHVTPISKMRFILDILTALVRTASPSFHK